MPWRRHGGRPCRRLRPAAARPDAPPALPKASCRGRSPGFPSAPALRRCAVPPAPRVARSKRPQCLPWRVRSCLEVTRLYRTRSPLAADRCSPVAPGRPPGLAQSLASARKVQTEGAALAELGLGCHRSPVALCYPSREVKAVAGSAAAGFVELEAEVEDLAEVAGIDADAVVADTNADTASLGGTLDGDGRLALRPVVEEEGVRHQGPDSLPHLLGVDVQGRQVVRDVHVYAALLDLEVVLEEDFFNDLAQGRGALGVRAGQQLDDVRHLVEHSLQLLHAGADAPEEVVPLLVQPVAVVAEKQLAEAVDREDGRLQVVRQDAEEVHELLAADQLPRTSLHLIHGRDHAPPRRRRRCVIATM